jgi:hypothetical protein
MMYKVAIYNSRAMISHGAITPMSESTYRWARLKVAKTWRS